jgi:hypothetical protein
MVATSVLAARATPTRASVTHCNRSPILREVLMPRRERSVTEGRLRFVARLLEGEGMSEVCRDFGISRKPGYKIFNRHKAEGVGAIAL